MRRLVFLAVFSLVALLVLAPAAVAQDVVCLSIDVCPPLPSKSTPPNESPTVGQPSESPTGGQPSESPTMVAPPPSSGGSVGGSTQSEGNTLRGSTLPPTGGPSISSVVGLMLLVGIGVLGLAVLRRTRKFHST